MDNLKSQLEACVYNVADVLGGCEDIHVGKEPSLESITGARNALIKLVVALDGLDALSAKVRKRCSAMTHQRNRKIATDKRDAMYGMGK